MTTQHKYQCAASTHLGQIRRNNEDAFIVTEISARRALFSSDGTLASPQVASDTIYFSDKNGVLITLADGMGGAQAGEIASQITIETIHKALSHLDNLAHLSHAPGALMNDLILEANQQIILYSEAYPDSKGMGTTCILAYVSPSLHCHIAWVGDSRAYLYGPNKGLRRVTKDHSLVQELVDLNQINEEEAFNHPDGNIITQSLGGHYRQVLPSHIQLDLEEEDVLMLCTDGLNSMLKEQEIETVFANCLDSDASGTVEALIQAANDAGGLDNITISVYKIKEVVSTTNHPMIKPDLVFTGAGVGSTEHSLDGNFERNVKGTRGNGVLKIALGLLGILCIAYLFYLMALVRHPLGSEEKYINHSPDTTIQIKQDSADAILPMDSLLSNRLLPSATSKSKLRKEDVVLQVVSNLINSRKAEELTDQLVEMGYDAECQCSAVPFKVLVYLPSMDSALQFKTNFGENHPEVIKKFKLKNEEFALLSRD